MREGKQFGAIDVGSNSVRCLAVRFSSGVLEYVDSSVRITRLTEGIGRGKYRIRKDPLVRTSKAVMEARRLLDEAGVEPQKMDFFATESLRSAVNAPEARSALEFASGIPVRILDGDEEAILSRRGALLGIDGADSVFDLGGGSLEISGEDGSVSIPAGAVRMRSSFGEGAVSIREEVISMLSERPPLPADRLAGVGGTSSAVVMMLKGIPVSEYHPAKIHGYAVSSGDLDALISNVSALPVVERASVMGLESERADIIVPGMIVIRALLEFMDLEKYTHSETDLLWAICAGAAERSGLRVTSARAG